MDSYRFLCGGTLSPVASSFSRRSSRSEPTDHNSSQVSSFFQVIFFSVAWESGAKLTAGSQAGSQADRSSREGIRETSKHRRGMKQREHEKAISKKQQEIKTIGLRKERTGP